MDNPSGTTESPVNPVELLYGSDAVESAQTNEQPKEVEETAEQEEEVVSEQSDSEVEVEEAEPEGEEADAVDESEVFVLEDGAEVTLNALVDAYKNKLNFQRDYTKKTTAAAEERKAAEALKADAEKAKAELAPRLQLLQDIESELGQLIMGDLSNVNWAEIRDSDPSQYLALKEAKEAREQAITTLKAKRDQAIAEHAREESAKLHESLDWADTAKREEDIKLIQGYVKESGIPDEVFASVTSHKLMTAIREAALYRKLQEKKPAVMRKVRQAPKVVSKPTKVAAPEKPKTGADLLYGS